MRSGCCVGSFPKARSQKRVGGNEMEIQLHKLETGYVTGLMYFTVCLSCMCFLLINIHTPLCCLILADKVDRGGKSTHILGLIIADALCSHHFNLEAVKNGLTFPLN